MNVAERGLTGSFLLENQPTTITIIPNKDDPNAPYNLDGYVIAPELRQQEGE